MTTETAADWEQYIGDILDTDITEKTHRLIHSFTAIKKEAIQDFFKIQFSMPETRSVYFDYITNLRWRKFLLSVYYADILSYPEKEDQVDFPRLWYIVNRFPQGFTVWWITVHHTTYPVGYTGWYYVDEYTFNHVAYIQNHPNPSITNRFFMPSNEKTPYLYLFNFSIAPVLNHSEYSSIVIKDYVSALNKLNYEGMFCATVSSDGMKVAEQFGMKPIGTIKTPERADSDTIYFFRRGEG